MIPPDALFLRRAASAFAWPLTFSMGDGTIIYSPRLGGLLHLIQVEPAIYCFRPSVPFSVERTRTADLHVCVAGWIVVHVFS